MDTPTRDFDRLASKRAEVDTYLNFTPARVDAYVASLMDPWSCTSKIPLGFPVKTTVNELRYKIPVSTAGSLATIGGNTFAIITGSPLYFWFNPNQFDSVNMLSVTTNGTSPALTLFTNWFPIMPSKGFVQYYSAYRVVSAGVKFVYTAAPLYARGVCFTNTSTARTATEVGTGNAGYSNLINEPDTKINSLSPGVIFSETYSPPDIDSLTFVSTSVVDPNRQEWSLYFGFENYDSVNSFSGYLDIAVNYELIVSMSSDQVIPSEVNEGGSEHHIQRALKEKKDRSANLKGIPSHRERIIDVAADIRRRINNFFD